MSLLTVWHTDLDLIYEQFLVTRKVVGMSPLSDLIESELNPGSEVQSEEAAKDWIKKTFSTIFRAQSSLLVSWIVGLTFRWWWVIALNRHRRRMLYASKG